MLVCVYSIFLLFFSLRGNNLGDSGAASIIKEVSDVATDAYNSRLQRQAKDLVSKSLTGIYICNVKSMHVHINTNMCLLVS